MDLWLYTIGEKAPRRLTDMKMVKRRPPEPDLRTEEEKQREEMLAPGVSSLAWSPDNQHILFTYIGDLFLVDIEGGMPRRLTDTKAAEEEVGFSPDGRYISFTRDGDIWLINLEDSFLRQLTRNGKENVTNGRYQWSSDSTRISFVFNDSTKVTDILIPNYMEDRASVVLYDFNTILKPVKPKVLLLANKFIYLPLQLKPNQTSFPRTKLYIIRVREYHLFFLL